MHELTIMNSILDMVRESARYNSITKISKLKLIIGRLTMIMPDSLHFCFEALRQESLFESATLEIEEVPAVIQCQACARESVQPDIYYFSCPACGSNQVEILKGRELYLDYYEGDRV